MKTIVCFGDSNTFGSPPMPDPHDRDRFEPGERWPGVMGQALGAGWTVIEEGLPGRTSVHDDPIEGADKNGLRALPIVLGSHRPIDVLVLMLGCNDLKTRFSVTPADIAASVGVLAETVLASRAGPGGKAPKLLIITPPSITEAGRLADRFRGGAEKSRELAPHYAAVAAGLRVDILDAGRIVVSDPLDGIHMATDQHAILGRAIAEKLRG